MANEQEKPLGREVAEFLAEEETLRAFNKDYPNFQPTNLETIAEMERLNQPPDPAILDRPIAPH